MQIIESLKVVGARKYIQYQGECGIEIETETKEDYGVPDLKFWSWHVDGSLRDFGKEFILKAPVSRGGELEAALDEFDSKISRKQKLIKDSYSTSVHVHINFLNNTWRELVNYITCYYAVENLLIKASGPDRLSNLFCLPICDAEGELESILTIVRAIQSHAHKKLAMISEDHNKYAALNICNIIKLGTLEVRSMRGVTDINVIKTWVDVLLKIKDYACTKDLTPGDIVDTVDRQGPEFLYQVFGEFVPFFDNIPNKKELIEKNIWYLAKIASSGKFDDPLWGFPKPKKIYKEKLTEVLNHYANDIFKAEYKLLVPHQRIVVEELVARDLNLGPRNLVFQDGDM